MAGTGRDVSLACTGPLPLASAGGDLKRSTSCGKVPRSHSRSPFPRIVLIPFLFLDSAHCSNGATRGSGVTAMGYCRIERQTLVSLPSFDDPPTLTFLEKKATQKSFKKIERSADFCFQGKNRPAVPASHALSKNIFPLQIKEISSTLANFGIFALPFFSKTIILSSQQSCRKFRRIVLCHATSPGSLYTPYTTATPPATQRGPTSSTPPSTPAGRFILLHPAEICWIWRKTLGRSFANNVPT